MITAFEARNNAIASEAQLNAWLEQLGRSIEAASKKGQRQIYFFSDEFTQGVTDFYHPYWARVTAALKAPPLSFTITPGKVKVGGGLGDLDYDADNPPMADVLYVSW